MIGEIENNLFIYLKFVTFQFGTFKVKKYKLIQLISKNLV